jgi:hypothetical protein
MTKGLGRGAQFSGAAAVIIPAALNREAEIRPIPVKAGRAARRSIRDFRVPNDHSSKLTPFSLPLKLKTEHNDMVRTGLQWVCRGSAAGRVKGNCSSSLSGKLFDIGWT